MADPDRFDWERAIRRSGLHPTTRLVLLTLGTYMSRDGTGARPTQDTLADATGLSSRAVRSHLGIAREAGWIERTRKGRGVGRDGGVASEYKAAVPTRSTGTTVPPDDTSTGTTVPPERKSQPERDASQPEPDDTSTGTTVPPIKEDHTDTPRSSSASSEEYSDEIQLAARREIREKRARGEAIRKPHALFLDICRQLAHEQHLDARLDEAQQEHAVDQWQRRLDSHHALGRNRARIPGFDEQALEQELADELSQDLVDAALDGFRQERTRLSSTGATP